MTKTSVPDSPNRRISRFGHEARLAEFASKLKPNSVAILVSNPESTRTGDTEYPYRQSSDVLYVNGFPEPNSALVISKFDGKLPELTMFVQPKDPAQEVWTGIRIGVEGARRSYGANRAYTVDQFSDVVEALLEDADHAYYRFGVNAEFDGQLMKIWQENQLPLNDPGDLLHEMRLTKSHEEIVLMGRAGDISAEAHCEAMRRCIPGLYEFQLQATLETVFTNSGASAPAYGSIVAGGNNACVLHYTTNRDRLADGDLVLIDAACEFDGYAADITRTFPVNGKFTEAQREIYELVLKAQLAGIRAAKPGSSLRRVHLATARVLRNGLVELGILPRERASLAVERRVQKLIEKAKEAKKEGKKPSVDPSAEPPTLDTFFMHGTSHWLGLDVHDVSAEGGRRGKAKKRPFEPGMALTVEPGLYFNKNDTRVPAKYRGIGVRIEDDIVITADGCSVLTYGVPKTVEEIEALMSSARAS